MFLSNNTTFLVNTLQYLEIHIINALQSVRII